MRNSVHRAHLILALLALLALGCLSPRTTHANVVCSITGGSYTTLNFNGTNTATGSVAFTCISYNSPGTYSICAGLGNPSFPGTNTQPVMTGPANTNFNLYTNPTYTSAWTASNPWQTSITLPAGNGVSVSGTMPYYGFIAAGQGLPGGTYSASFFNTVLGAMSGGTCQASAGVVSGLDSTLPVADSVTAGCSVTASNIGLGAVASTATNVSGSGTITIQCNPSTKYFVGLAPSNGNVNGAGTMTGSAGNGSSVPYQLYQDSAHSIIWGNTANSTSPGNGTGGNSGNGGHGNGNAQGYSVYVLVPSANYPPDNYMDTVTVTVNF
jgi:spore coat protein U-like protein